MGLHREGPWAQLRLERFKKENNLSRFTLGKSFWEQHREWIGRSREVGQEAREEEEEEEQAGAAGATAEGMEKWAIGVKPGWEEGLGKGKGDDEVRGHPLRLGRGLPSAETKPCRPGSHGAGTGSHCGRRRGRGSFLSRRLPRGPWGLLRVISRRSRALKANRKSVRPPRHPHMPVFRALLGI